MNKKRRKKVIEQATRCPPLASTHVHICTHAHTQHIHIHPTSTHTNSIYVETLIKSHHHIHNSVPSHVSCKLFGPQPTQELEAPVLVNSFCPEPLHQLQAMLLLLAMAKPPP